MANAPSWEDQAVLEFFETSSRNLLAAEAAAGVRHHVALSIVGTERLPENGYFRAKVAQESLIKASGIPYSILRATQFFEFVGGIADSFAVGEELHVSPALIQPLASDDVVAALTDVVLAAPLNGTVEVAGPEAMPIDELVRRFLRATRDTRQVVPDVHARYYGAVLDDQSLTPGQHPRLGAICLKTGSPGRWPKPVAEATSDPSGRRRPVVGRAVITLTLEGYCHGYPISIGCGFRSTFNRHSVGRRVAPRQGDRRV